MEEKEEEKEEGEEEEEEEEEEEYEDINTREITSSIIPLASLSKITLLSLSYSTFDLLLVSFLLLSLLFSSSSFLYFNSEVNPILGQFPSAVQFSVPIPNADLGEREGRGDQEGLRGGKRGVNLQGGRRGEREGGREGNIFVLLYYFIFLFSRTGRSKEEKKMVVIRSF